MKRDSLPLAAPPFAFGGALAPGWRAALPALAVALVVLGLGFGDTAAGIVGIWYRSTTFTHGFVVIPIALWLIWRRRDRLRAIEPRPWFAALPLIALVGAVWLVGEMATVNALSQTAFVVMVILSVPAILGREAARTIAFPLAFLLFAVPVGDFLLPTLMDRTADFTVLALRATGVPVYREGLLIVVPNGRWSIVEACSGVRYLIASLVAGTLFAYLNYRANWRRWIFVAFSAIVPIVANWFRAYLIVLLGYLSDNRIAAGVDHLIYGWIFFGFVMLLMFWVGSLWKEPGAADAAGRGPVLGTAASSPVRPARFWPAAAGVAAVALAWPLTNFATEVPVRAGSAGLEVGAVPGWNSSSEVDGPAANFGSTSALVERAYHRDAGRVGLRLAYYQAQNSGRRLTGWETVLATGDESKWVRTIRVIRDVRIGGVSYGIAETHLHSPDGRSFVAWQWSWIDGAITTGNLRAKLRIGWSRLAHRRDDSAAIVVYAEDRKERPAVETLQRFVDDAWPTIDAALRQVERGG